MRPHMLSQPINPLRQDGNLHLRGAGIGVRFTVFADYLGFSLFRDRHSFLVVYVVLLLTSWAVVYRRVILTQRQKPPHVQKIHPKIIDFTAHLS